MNYIICLHENMLFIYDPIKSMWVTSLDMDIDIFQIPEATAHIHLLKAVDLWKCEGVSADGVKIIPVETLQNIY